MEAQMNFLLRGWRVWRRVWVEFPQLQRMESIPVGAVGGYGYNLESDFSLLCPEDRLMVL